MNPDFEDTVRIPLTTMKEMVFGPRPRRVRLPTKMIFLAAFFGATVGCATSRPVAVETETVGTLVAGSSVWHAPTHKTTDFAAPQVVEGDDSTGDVATTVSAAVEMPEVAAKTDGVTMRAEVR